MTQVQTPSESAERAAISILDLFPNNPPHWLHSQTRAAMEAVLRSQWIKGENYDFLSKKASPDAVFSWRTLRELEIWTLDAIAYFSNQPVDPSTYSAWASANLMRKTGGFGAPIQSLRDRIDTRLKQSMFQQTISCLFDLLVNLYQEQYQFLVAHEPETAHAFSLDKVSQENLFFFPEMLYLFMKTPSRGSVFLGSSEWITDDPFDRGYYQQRCSNQIAVPQIAKMALRTCSILLDREDPENCQPDLLNDIFLWEYGGFVDHLCYSIGNYPLMDSCEDEFLSLVWNKKLWLFPTTYQEIAGLRLEVCAFFVHHHEKLSISSYLCNLNLLDQILAQILGLTVQAAKEIPMNPEQQNNPHECERSAEHQDQSDAPHDPRSRPFENRGFGAIPSFDLGSMGKPPFASALFMGQGHNLDQQLFQSLLELVGMAKKHFSERSARHSDPDVAIKLLQSGLEVIRNMKLDEIQHQEKAVEGWQMLAKQLLEKSEQREREARDREALLQKEIDRSKEAHLQEAQIQVSLLRERIAVLESQQSPK